MQRRLISTHYIRVRLPPILPSAALVAATRRPWPTESDGDLGFGAVAENCTHPQDIPGVTTETGQLGNPDCWNMTLYNTGCIVAETKPNNYGPGFAANGGGAYAVQWTETAMSFWFFPVSKT